VRDLKKEYRWTEAMTSLRLRRHEKNWKEKRYSRRPAALIASRPRREKKRRSGHWLLAPLTATRKRRAIEKKELIREMTKRSSSTNRARKDEREPRQETRLLRKEQIRRKKVEET